MHSSTARPLPRTQSRPVALAVEDDGFERLRLVAILERLGFEVLAAADGAQALSALATRDADVVITDWQLPVLSGIDVCRTLRNADPARRPFTMMVTSRGEVEDLVEGLEAGADDFMTKPYRAGELEARLRSGQRLQQMRRDLVERSRTLEQALRHQDLMRQDLDADLTAAVHLQHMLIDRSTTPLPGLALAHLFRPARSISGDVFGVTELDRGRAGFFHIDATGHGAAAALHAFAIATALMGLGGSAAEFDDPAVWVSDFNARALKLGADLGCSLVVGWVDRNTGQGRLCQAGHPHPLVVARDGEVRPLGRGGLPIGAMEGARYETTEFTLATGERLVVFSDGVNDCVNPMGQRFGEDRLQQALTVGAGKDIHANVRAVERELDSWRCTATYDDDVSLLALELVGVG
jgi:sigma-B regulation protein RsbU (phosphoserine phosphatase)